MNQYNIWNNNSNTNKSANPQHQHQQQQQGSGHYNGWYNPQLLDPLQQQPPPFQNPGQIHQQQQQHMSDQQLSPDLLINKLNNLSSSSNYNSFLQSLDGQPGNNNNYLYGSSKLVENIPNYPHNNINNNVFNLPLELQGGVSNISSRRPSFAAEQSYTGGSAGGATGSNGQANNNNNHNSLNLLAHSNNFNNFYNNTSGQQNQLLQNFRSRRPSIQIGNSGGSSGVGHLAGPGVNGHGVNNNNNNNNNNGNAGNNGVNLELDNGLLLNGNLLITSPTLRAEYSKTKNYFTVGSANEFYSYLQEQIQKNEYLKKIIINLKKLNNLFNLMKPLVLVLTKAGKFEILSTPINSNIFLNKDDVVIVDGDRGKDLVYVLDPSISLDVAILINYLKKRQHSKSMSYGGTTNSSTANPAALNPIISNTVADLVKGQGILDEETQFQIPSKQVLRFATYQEIKNLQFKLLEELKSYKTSLLKISNLSNLNTNLTILNSEYQFDQKKLTFFYFANQRLDFRNLIKELFKIYKTRIWLCAVPKPPNFDNNGNSTTSHGNGVGGAQDLNNVEFENFVVDDFHVRNFGVTLEELMNEN